MQSMRLSLSEQTKSELQSFLTTASIRMCNMCGLDMYRSDFADVFLLAEQNSDDTFKITKIWTDLPDTYNKEQLNGNINDIIYSSLPKYIFEKYKLYPYMFTLYRRRLPFDAHIHGVYGNDNIMRHWNIVMFQNGGMLNVYKTKYVAEYYPNDRSYIDHSLLPGDELILTDEIRIEKGEIWLFNSSERHNFTDDIDDEFNKDDCFVFSVTTNAVNLEDAVSYKKFYESL